ncbi:MAG: hypothetical protein A2161_14695, partial [Candidatus Schekmanbacteria bacterium RBG_13_48_7]
MENPNVAILILHYQNARLTEQCVESVLKTTYSFFSIYVIENGTLDPVPDNFFHANPGIKHIQFAKNYGFAEGYNRAINQIDDEYIALLNNDTIVDPNWLSPLISPLLENAKIAFTGSRIFFNGSRDLIIHAGGRFTTVGLGIDMFLGKPSSELSCQQSISAFVCGAAMAFSKYRFIELGAFDTSYFAYGEDVDICWRAWMFGYEVIHVPESIVYHHFSAATSWESPTKIRLCHRNKYFNIIKNMELLPLFFALIIALCYDILKMIIFVSDLNFTALQAILNGYWELLTHLFTLISNRKTIQKKRRFPD